MTSDPLSPPQRGLEQAVDHGALTPVRPTRAAVDCNSRLPIHPKPRPQMRQSTGEATGDVADARGKGAREHITSSHRPPVYTSTGSCIRKEDGRHARWQQDLQWRERLDESDVMSSTSSVARVGGLSRRASASVASAFIDMRAVVIHKPGGPEVLTLEDREIPAVRPGLGAGPRARLRPQPRGADHPQRRIRPQREVPARDRDRVRRRGRPDPSDGDLNAGQTVVVAYWARWAAPTTAAYQQYALLPLEDLRDPDRDHARLGHAGGDPGDVRHRLGLARGAAPRVRRRLLLVHGGTSSVGMAAITIAKDRGLTVFATTRQEAKRAALAANGADHVLIDDGGRRRDRCARSLPAG